MYIHCTLEMHLYVQYRQVWQKGHRFSEQCAMKEQANRGVQEYAPQGDVLDINFLNSPLLGF